MNIAGLSHTKLDIVIESDLVCSVIKCGDTDLLQIVILWSFDKCDKLALLHTLGRIGGFELECFAGLIHYIRNLSEPGKGGGGVTVRHTTCPIFVWLCSRYIAVEWGIN